MSHAYENGKHFPNEKNFPCWFYHTPEGCRYSDKDCARSHKNCSLEDLMRNHRSREKGIKLDSPPLHLNDEEYGRIKDDPSYIDKIRIRINNKGKGKGEKGKRFVNDMISLPEPKLSGDWVNGKPALEIKKNKEQTAVVTSPRNVKEIIIEDISVIDKIREEFQEWQDILIARENTLNSREKRINAVMTELENMRKELSLIRKH